MEDLNTFLDLYGLAAIFGLMLAKSVGVPIPVPADALMLATSARVATGKLALVQAFIALLIALIAGGMARSALANPDAAAAASPGSPTASRVEAKGIRRPHAGRTAPSWKASIPSTTNAAWRRKAC